MIKIYEQGIAADGSSTGILFSDIIFVRRKIFSSSIIVINIDKRTIEKVLYL